MTVPTIRVEIAFGHGAYSAPSGAQWIDVTADVFEITTNRGRTSEFEQFPAGTCSIGLYNDSRQWDPLNTAGTYYGDLVANTPVRVVATISAVDYHIWRGYVDGWPVTYTDAGTRSEVRVQCTDATRLLAERKMPDTHAAYLAAAAHGTPPTWYKCDGIEDGVIVNTGTVGRDLIPATAIGAVGPLSPVSVGALGLPVQTPIDVNSRAVAASAPIYADTENPTAGTTFTVSALIQYSEHDFKEIINTVAGANFVVRFGLGDVIYTTAFMEVDTNGDGSADLGVAGSVPIDDGVIHHVVGVRNGTTASIYVDGVFDASVTAGGSTGSVAISNGRLELGRTAVGPSDPGPALVLDELMVWPTALSAAEIATLYDQLTSGYADQQLSGAAIGTILDEIGWPASLRNIDTGETLVKLPAWPRGRGVWELLNSVALTEGGRLFIDAQGRVTFHERSRFMTETVESTVQYTFSGQTRDASPSGVGLLDGTLTITVDDRLTYDAAEVAREGGETQRAELTATPARTYSASGLLSLSDSHALNFAEWIVFRYGTALPRSDAWEIDPETMPADWDNILGLDIGHRIKHDITPGGIGSSIDLAQHLSLVGHNITPDGWTITMNGTPTDPNEGAYFLWATVVTADNDNGWADSDGDPPGGYWG